MDGFNCRLYFIPMPPGLVGTRDREMQQNRECRDDGHACRLRPHGPLQLQSIVSNRHVWSREETLRMA